VGGATGPADTPRLGVPSTYANGCDPVIFEVLDTSRAPGQDYHVGTDAGDANVELRAIAGRDDAGLHESAAYARAISAAERWRMHSPHRSVSRCR
jgi:hypothetical protein